MAFYPTLLFIFNLFKSLHILILFKKKLMPSLVPHSVGHVDFLLIEQVSAHPLNVYFSNSDKGAKPFLA